MSDLAKPVISQQNTTFQTGVLLVVAATLCWSFGGAIDRFISAPNTWTVVFWRSVFAGLFIVCFMIARDGLAGAIALITSARWPTLIVGLLYTVSTVCFVLALSYTSVAKVLLIQSSSPILAAGMAWLLLRERVAWYTMIAIVAVVAGITTIVSGSLSVGGTSLLGDILSLIMVSAFTLTIVISRKYPGIRMTPAILLGVVVAGIIASTQASTLSVTLPDLGWLAIFGMVNLGLGLALFVTGARLIPSVLSALLSVIEPILGPVWVWLFHSEVPGGLVLVGGSVVIAALVFNMIFDWREANRKPALAPSAIQN
jgi:drug/metabolite transporter (DMT)-like permease